MKTISVLEFIDFGEPIPVSIIKNGHRASTTVTEPISVEPLSLPMQDAMRRFVQPWKGTLDDLAEYDATGSLPHHFSLTFDDDEGYTDWLRRNHPEEQVERFWGAE